MNAEVVIAAVLMMTITLAKFLKDLLVVGLLRELTRNNCLSRRQRFEICARLVSALGSAVDTTDHGRATGMEAGTEREFAQQPDP